MGNVFLQLKEKKKADANTSNLTNSLLHYTMIEKYDQLEERVFILEQHTKANLEVMSADIHVLHQRTIQLKK
jgi:hypothetical protein